MYYNFENFNNFDLTGIGTLDPISIWIGLAFFIIICLISLVIYLTDHNKNNSNEEKKNSDVLDDWYDWNWI